MASERSWDRIKGKFKVILLAESRDEKFKTVSDCTIEA
jgi:hypothetical protein